MAEAAGVSPATVSNAFNRPERLSPAVRAKVLAVAAELGYSADPTARSLRTGRAGAIGVVFTVELSYAFSDPYFNELLAGLTEVTEQSGSGVLLIPIGHCPPGASEDARLRAVLAVERAAIDGAVADAMDRDHPALRALQRRGIPVVTSFESSGRCVRIDDRLGGHLVGEHLAELGHRRVAVVVAHPAPPGTALREVLESELYPYSRLRLAGIREALGSGVELAVVSGGRNAVESGRLAGELALNGPTRPTAIAADSDVLALGVLEALRERGLMVGSHVAVTGFDDLAAAEDVGLTTVRQPVREKGRLMARMLLDPAFVGEQLVLPTELVIRSSTAAAHRPRFAAGSFQPTERTVMTSDTANGTAVATIANAVHPPPGGATPAHDPPVGGMGGHPTTSVWRPEVLDLAAYLTRVGFDAEPRPNLATLRRLHRAHVGTVPFENLDVMLGRGTGTELDGLQNKIVRGGRGGYCYESNLLFAAALDQAGFATLRLLARTHDPVVDPRPRCHLMVLVHVEGAWWLCDVGYGSGPLEPVPLGDPTPTLQGRWVWRVVRGEDGWWRLQELQAGEWVTAYTVTCEATYPVDVQVANDNTSTHPNSPFVRHPIVVQRLDDVERRLIGRRLTLLRPDRTETSRDVPDEEYGDALRSFGLDLDPAEVRVLIGTLDGDNRLRTEEALT